MGLPRLPIIKINIVDENRDVISVIPIMKYCTKCKEYKAPNEFEKDKRLNFNLGCYCKECNKIRNNQWRKAKPEKQKEYKLMARFGITYREYKLMLESQNYECKICRTHLDVTARKVLCVDHCHSTNKIRGLLCDNCNKGLGHFYDKPELLIKAVEYLSEANKIAI